MQDRGLKKSQNESKDKKDSSEEIDQRGVGKVQNREDDEENKTEQVENKKKKKAVGRVFYCEGKVCKSKIINDGWRVYSGGWRVNASQFFTEEGNFEEELGEESQPFEENEQLFNKKPNKTVQIVKNTALKEIAGNNENFHCVFDNNLSNTDSKECKKIISEVEEVDDAQENKRDINEETFRFAVDSFKDLQKELESAEEKAKKMYLLLENNKENMTTNQQEEWHRKIEEVEDEKREIKKKLVEKNKFIYLYMEECELNSENPRYRENMREILEIDSMKEKKKNKDLIDILKNKKIFIENRTFDDYEIFECSVRKNQNRIYKARLKRGGKDVVIKSFPYNQDNKKYIQNEGINLLKLRECQFIIMINCVFISVVGGENYLCFEMDYIEKDLLCWLKGVSEGEEEDLMKIRNKKPIEDIKCILKQIVVAMGYIHSKGIVLNNLKPQNILVNENDRIKIIDFGRSKNDDIFFLNIPNQHYIDQLSRYVGPEGKATKKNDVYSFGKILYETAVASYLNFKKRHFDYVECPNFLSKTEVDLIKNCLSFHPEDRINFEEIMIHDFFGFEEVKDLKQEIVESDTKIVMVDKLLRNFLEEKRSMQNQPLPAIQFEITRNERIVEKVLSKISLLNGFDELVLQPWFVIFKNQHTGENETGHDGGGLTNEMLDFFSKQFPEFTLSIEEGTYLPIDDFELGTVFESFGKLMLKTLFSRENTVGINFSLSFYSSILEKEPKSFEQLLSFAEDFDPTVTKNLRKFLQINNNSILEDFSFEKNGKTYIVNKYNKKEYVCRVLKKLLDGVEFRKKNLLHLKRGFYEFLPFELKKIIKTLNHLELKKLLFGVYKLDSETMIKQFICEEREWEEHIEKKNCFIQMIKNFNQEELKFLLYYCTSLKNLPADGCLAKKIELNISDRFFAHTCVSVRSLELNVYLSSLEEFKNEFLSVLKKAKDSEMHDQ